MNDSHDKTVLARIQTVDIARGLIMVIMALDHVRDFFHITAFTADPLDPEATTVTLFFTRWITHFCAPSFLLLSGISASLSGRRSKLGNKANFLVKRGLLLVLVEITVITLALSFDLTYKFIFLQVIWAIGWSMVFLGLAIRFLKPTFVAIVGLALIFGHNVFDFVKIADTSPFSVIINVLLTSGGRFYPVGPFTIGVLYTILPWTGIMFLGYGIGEFYRSGFLAAERKQNLLILGIGSILMFLILRGLNVYGDPVPWKPRGDSLKTVLSFLNVTKYPPSLLYSLITVGPVLLFLALSEQWHGRISRVLIVYGRVPFFYFVVHFFLIHTLSAVVVLLSGYTWNEATDPSLFFQFRPVSFGFELGGVYLIWIIVVAVMYPLCRWFGQYKATHQDWWLSYL